ncbi:hypothetical protein GCM10018781_52230 [Kitasatospora indigofera]|uniref:Uncharacterized protein n=1 Tax=Kitasatospora indigofera TaxID=67307 RepID=A0A919G5G4_9ACTN|nr:hypothetical protein GCM10018781_52230 [Kitasatospora indigofera]
MRPAGAGPRGAALRYFGASAVVRAGRRLRSGVRAVGFGGGFAVVGRGVSGGLGAEGWGWWGRAL